MATCYDCIHCGACSDAGDSGFSSLKEDVSKCKNFKNKSDYAEVKHGEWKQGVPYVCSICGKPASDEKNTDEKYSCWLSPYCPYCGAKMSVNYKSSKNER